MSCSQLDVANSLAWLFFFIFIRKMCALSHSIFFSMGCNKLKIQEKHFRSFAGDLIQKKFKNYGELPELPIPHQE